MFIKEKLSQHRRDFRALYRCEGCGFEVEGVGYDDRHFHESVIPAMQCKQCGAVAPDTYEPMATVYEDWEVV